MRKTTGYVLGEIYETAHFFPLQLPSSLVYDVCLMAIFKKNNKSEFLIPNFYLFTFFLFLSAPNLSDDMS